MAGKKKILTHIIIVTLLLTWGVSTNAQTNTSLLRSKNVNNSQMIGVNSPLDGSIVFGSANTSLFQRDPNRWIQLRQTLRVCNDQLNILNGNSAILPGLLPHRLGETLSWNGNKWNSDSLLFVTTDTVGFRLMDKISVNRPEEVILSEDDPGIAYVLFRDGVHVVDVSSPHEISFIYSYVNQLIHPSEGLQPYTAMAKKDSFIYVSIRNFRSRILKINPDSSLSLFSSWLTQNMVDSFALSTPSWMICEGDYLYVRDEGFIGCINVSDPSSPGDAIPGNASSSITSNSWTSFPWAEARLLAYRESDNTLFSLRSNSTSSGLMAFQGFGTTSITKVEDTYLSGASSGEDIVLNEAKSRAYVGDAQNVLRIFNIENPTSITHQQGFIPSYLQWANSSAALDIHEDVLALKTTHHLGFFDISDPSVQPPVTFSIETPNEKKSNALRFDGIYVYATDMDNNTFYVYGKVKPSVNINTKNPMTDLNVNGNASKQGGGNWLGYSDRRIKKKISSYSKGLDVIRNITPYQFNYRTNSGYTDTTTTFTGVMAQEMQHILPQSVSSINDTKGPSGLKDKLQFDSSPILWNLVNAVQELKNEQDLIEQKINSKSNEK